MGTVKKFNKNTQKWEAVSTSDANAIKVQASELIPEGLTHTNVENVLQTMHEDIQTLKGNVSWLAMYGGGGSGGGGGVGGSSEGNITVNEQHTGSNIVFEDELRIKVKAANSTLKWEITVYGGTALLKYTASGTSLTINKTDLDKAGITKTFNLSITAFNSDIFTSLYWDGQVIISTVSIQTENQLSFAYDPNINESIIYHYNIGISGNYYFKINGYTISGTAINLSTLSGTINVPLSELMVEDTLQETTHLQPGVNQIKAELINVDNPAINNSFVSSIILTTTDPIIYQISLSSSQEEPTEVQVFGDSTSISVPFNVYFSGTTYLYYLTCSKLINGGWEPIDTNSWGTTYIQYNSYNSNASYFIYPQFLTMNTIYKITIKIKDVVSSKEFTADRFIKTISPKTGLLESRIENAKVFEFCTFTGTIQDGLWKVDSKTSLTEYNFQIQNINNESANINNDSRLLRFQNASYAKVPFSTDIINAKKEFSLHICYKPDYHPDSNRTILQWNDLGSSTQAPSSTGILLKNKCLYIYTNTAVFLEEKEVLDITITYKPEDSAGSNGTLFVYLDGVIECVLQLSYDQIVPKNLTDFFIGASVNLEGEAFDFTDMNLYNFSLYNVCLSPYDILINRLNNQARVNLRNSAPDTDYIEKGLLRNFLTSNEEGTNVKESMLYDINIQDISFNNNSTSSGQDGILNSYFKVANFIDGVSQSLRDSIKSFTIPIPIVYINVGGNSQWTWENFISPQTGDTALEKCSALIEYYDQNLEAGTIFKLNQASVKPQGTSTLADYIKNLNISFEDGVLFSPKETWFPEQTYTLKADIVDSSHSLNTAIGKFVNTEFGTLTDTFYPFSNVVRTNFSDRRDQEHFPKATLKHGVEGFPVLVLMNFYNTNGLDVHSLGIYQFILGRDSPRNLGYEIITGVQNEDGSEVVPFISYPLYREGVKLSTKSIKGYWFEYGLNESFSDDTEFQNLLDGATSTENNNRIAQANLTGAFWQNDKDYYNKTVDIKYNNLGQNAVSVPGDFEPFNEFVRNVQKLPVTVKRYSDADGFKRKTIGGGMSYPKYSYVKDSGGSYIWQKNNNESNSTAARGDDLASVISNLNIDCISKFFVIAMLFGLLDNFQKNLPIKFYLGDDGNWEPPLLGIYDTDSGLGQNNQAEQNITESLWMCGLGNTQTDFFETKRGANSTIVATSNKLWFLDSDDLNYSGFAVGENDKGSIYATQWNNIKKFFNENRHQFELDGVKKALSIQQFPEYFYKNYFLPQTEGCGELLFNLTYIAKYITKYSTGSNSFTNQINKLHGRRLYQVKNWLTNRVKFLDSMFDAMGLLAGNSTVPSISSVAINAALSPELKITTNSPVIVKYTNQGTSARYIYCNKNEEQGIYFGASALDTSDYAKSHVLYSSDSIIKLGTGDNPLYDIGFASINTGSLPYLTEYNVSAPSRSALNKNGLSSMDSGYMFGKFTIDNKSELRTIDFRNTYPSSQTASYSLNLENGFSKLQNLYINNSCITDVRFPIGVSLRDFNVSGSNLTQLNLSNQNFIKNLDLTNCVELSSLTITNCENLNNLNINKSTSKLATIEVSSNGLKTVVIDNNSVKNVTLISTKLSSITINSQSIESLTINSESLKELNVNNCVNLHTLQFGSVVSTIETLKLNSTKIKTLTAGSDILDLSGFTSLTDLDLRNNEALLNVQFENNKDKPVLLNNTFSGCKNLQRVFGHISPKLNSVFYGCENFSIHNGRYNNQDTQISSQRTKLCLKSANDLHEGNGTFILLSFQEGNNVTNLSFNNVTNLSNMFRGTSCDEFDVYYVLTSLNNNKKYDLSNLFYELKNRIFNWTETLDNSPSRYMFQYNTDNIQSLNSCFRSSLGQFKVYSPEKEADGNFSSDKSKWGLFTFLEKCSNISLIFYDCKFAIDRNIFRHPNTNNTTFQFPIKNIVYFSPSLVVNNIYDESYKNLNSLTLNQFTVEQIKTLGDLSGMFVNLSNLTDIGLFLNSVFFLQYQNYHSWYLPSKNILKSFRSNYAIGEFKLESVFKNKSILEKIENSFITFQDISTTFNELSNPLFEIHDELFSQCSNLTSISTQGTGDYGGTVLSTEPFTGFKKILSTNVFPMNIVANCPRLIYFEGFFKNCEGVLLETPELPGEMFKNNTQLKSVAATFFNLGFEYKLSSGSFANCSNLNNVSYIFGADDSCVNKISGSIPYKLFYHGSQNVTKTFKGINGTVSSQPLDTGKTLYTIQKESGQTYYQISSEMGIYFYSKLEPATDESYKDVYGYNRTYQVDSSAIYDTETISYSIPRKNINNCDNCFARANVSEYVHNFSWEGQDNEEYSPYQYNFSNNFFVLNNSRDLNKTTYIWEFDGITKDSEAVDCDKLDVGMTTGNGDIVLDSYTIGTIKNFCCPPDLFRYCSANIPYLRYIFYKSGASTHSVNYENYWPQVKNQNNILSVGIQGRIPPYLLKPVPGVQDLTGFFTNCKRLSYYIDSKTNMPYLIPENFFMYTPEITKLSYTFSGLLFPTNIQLNVFGNLSKLQDVSFIFQFLYINPKERTIIKEIFPYSNHKALSNISNAFAMSTAGKQETSHIKQQKITFDNVFKGNTFNEASDVTKCRYVFANYIVDPDYVVFENKSLPQSIKFDNYVSY